MVISESSPEDLKRSDGTNDSQAYFNTIASFCQKYNKPIIYLDPLSLSGYTIEFLLGLFGLFYGAKHSFKIVTKNSNRRDFLKGASKTIGGMYLFMSDFNQSSPVKYLIASLASESNNVDETINNALGNEKYFLNHIIDQRNVQMTNRLVRLPTILNHEDFLKGDYALSISGTLHAIGIGYYLRHPRVRQIKSLIYGISYDLIDSDEIAKFVPSDGSWKKSLLNP